MNIHAFDLDKNLMYRGVACLEAVGRYVTAVKVLTKIFHHGIALIVVLSLRFRLTLDQFDCVYIPKKYSGLTIDYFERKYFELTVDFSSTIIADQCICVQH